MRPWQIDVPQGSELQLEFVMRGSRGKREVCDTSGGPESIVGVWTEGVGGAWNSPCGRRLASVSGRIGKEADCMWARARIGAMCGCM